MALPEINRPLNDEVLNAYFFDLGLAQTASVVSPVNGRLVAVYSVINGTLSGADAICTAGVGSTPCTNGQFTITQSGSAVGDVDSAFPSANNDVLEGQRLFVQSNGGPSNTASATLTFVVRK
jgi:hypothetical protein